jgi:pimeloyl-ACP methyl ester carboxylesterase
VTQVAPAPSSWAPPTGITPRGTVLVLPGRGEDPSVYERFGRRLAVDGYPVRVLAGGAPSGPLDQEGPHPVVLVGSDTGALEALLLAGSVDGVILAGTPLPSGARVNRVDFDAELDARTACPTHRARLVDDTSFVRGSLFTPVPPELTDAVVRLDLEHLDVPVLVLHGDADVVTPVAAVEALARRLPKAEFVTVHDGRHDVLNDLPHRTVAAHVVQWLERLRTGAPILSVHTL